MSLPRDLTLQLQKKLDKKRDKYLGIFADSNKIFESENGVERIFDKFPFLLSEISLEVFKKITSSVRLVENEDMIIEQDSQQALESFVRKLIKDAIVDLLNEQGMIKAELMQLLGWNRNIHMDQQKICGIISAYVAHSVHKLNKKTSNQLGNDNGNKQAIEFDSVNKSASALNFINKNFKKWILDEVENSDRVYDSDYFFRLDWVHVKEKACKVVKNYQTPILASGFFSMGVALMFFNSQRQTVKDDEFIPKFQLK